MTDSAPGIFLSHARADMPFVRAVADELRLQGFDPWFAADAVTAGTPWADRVAEALATSDIVVVFIGSAPDSPWLNFEIGAAVGGGKRVVPVYVTDDAMRTVPSTLATFQGIQAHDQTPEQVARQITRAISVAA